jgi:hypothetical protein
MLTPAPRAELLRAIVEYALPVDTAVAELGSYPWDCDEPIFVVTRAHVTSIVERDLSGELTSEQVERWGDLLEVREDVEFEPAAEKTVREVIWELANPLLTEPLSKTSAVRMRDALATQRI